MPVLWLCGLSALMALFSALLPPSGPAPAVCALAAALCALLAAAWALLARRRGLRRVEQIQKKLDGFQHCGIPYEAPLDEGSLAALEQSLAQICRLAARDRENRAWRRPRPPPEAAGGYRPDGSHGRIAAAAGKAARPRL